jgi:N-acylneuraminate cytidylyltransferase
MTPNVLALIPARAGSKGVPGKNKRVVQGLALVQYAIAAARACEMVTHIAVSSDDDEILAIAREQGVEAIERPSGISEDNSPVIEAVRHACTELEVGKGIAFDAIALLQPTSPLRTGGDVGAAISMFFNTGCPVCSVFQVEDCHPARMYRLEDGRLKSLFPEFASLRRQDLPPIYLRNGALYVFGRRELESGQIISHDMLGYVMPGATAINVDTELDLAVLEAYLAKARWIF